MEVRAGSVVALLAAGWACILAGCGGGAPPTKTDIVGTWKNVDGARLEFDDDGRFVATAFPTSILWIDAPPGTADGVGSWQLAQERSGTVVKLSFDRILDEKDGYGMPLYISGSGSSRKLYHDIDDEGFDRYEFTKE